MKRTAATLRAFHCDSGALSRSVLTRACQCHANHSTHYPTESEHCRSICGAFLQLQTGCRKTRRLRHHRPPLGGSQAPPRATVFHNLRSDSHRRNRALGEGGTGMSRSLRSRMKGQLSGCRTNARRGSAVAWFVECWAKQGPPLSPPQRKQRSRTRRKKK